MSINWEKDLLKNIEHIVVTNNESRQISDAYDVYANHPKREGKTIHVSVSELENLLNDIKNSGENTHTLNLVLLGDFDGNSPKLAGINPEEIAQILTDHVNINRVTLLGCNTAAAERTNHEKNMIEKYNKNQTDNKSGFIITNNKPEEKDFPSLFEKINNHSNPTTANILFIYTPPNNITKLVKDPQNNDITETDFPLRDDQIKNFKLIVGNKHGELPSPTKNIPMIIYHGGKSASLLPAASTFDLLELLTDSPYRFDRNHPSFSSTKSIYPFLSAIDLDSNEEDKITTSFLKYVIKAIKSTPKISRDIIVKGYPAAVLVDTLTHQFIVSKESIYTKDYNRVGLGFFSRENPKSNIDPKSKKNSYAKMEKKLAPDKSEFATSAKAIRFHIIKK